MDTAWIVIGIVVVALLVFAAVRLFDGGTRKNITDDANKQAQNLKAAAEAALVVELRGVEADQKELDGIKLIKDDKKRLEAIAEYANRRRKR